MNNSKSTKLKKLYIKASFMLLISVFLIPFTFDSLLASSESGNLLPGQKRNGQYANYSAYRNAMNNQSSTTGTALPNGCFTVTVHGLYGYKVSANGCYIGKNRTNTALMSGGVGHSYYGALGQ